MNLISLKSRTYFEHHSMHIDPNEEILEERKFWNLIEKETFRRAFWCLIDVGVTCDLILVTTSQPLADSRWNCLPDAFMKVHPNPLIAPLPRDSNIVIMCEHKEFLGQVQSILYRAARKDLNNREVHRESKQISENLRAWGERISKIRPLSLKPASEQDWFCVLVHVLWHSTVLLNNRIFLVQFLIWKTKSLCNSFLDQSHAMDMQQSLQECHISTTEILSILKNIILKNDSFELDCQSWMPAIFIQSCIFLGILSQFGDSDVVRREAASDYSLVKSYLRKLAGGQMNLRKCYCYAFLTSQLTLNDGWFCFVFVFVFF
ncbi:hypothetical protein HK096_007111 [Nowakowskiella sp. JEL0078]|nr:hypothetical protein HK096_007111 [Nowakowskiella sp. JEL0078]